MSEVIDARGLSCPQRVFLTKKTLEKVVVGKVSTMYTLTETILSAGRLVTV